MLGFAVLFNAARSRPFWRNTLSAVLAVGVLWNLLLLALFLTRRIAREEAVSYSDAGHALTGWFAGLRPF